VGKSAISPKVNIANCRLGHDVMSCGNRLASQKAEPVEKLPRTVVIVEDDPSMRKSLERLLAAYGYRTEGYASAESFLARGHPAIIHCMVLDIELGGMNGIELRQHLTIAKPGLDVIFITALDDEILEMKADQVGCVAYLRKPFAASSLLSAIELVR
jgi:FixJ family two-component response regulator